MSVLVALQHGVSLARENGQRVRHLVLTDKDGGLDMDAFYRGFTKRLVPRLRRGGYLAEYAVALEAQPDSGRLHGHVLLIEPAFVGPLRAGERRPSTGRGYIPKPLLDRMADDCGFGWAFIREVRDIPAANASLVEYFIKGLGGDHSVPSKAVGQIGTYMAKAHEMARLSGFAKKRLRPFRVSSGWPLNLTQASEQLRREMFGEPDPGPWVMIKEADCDPWLAPIREQQRLERDRGERWDRAAALKPLADEAGLLCHERKPASFKLTG